MLTFISQEIIQNAEDAGAKKVRFMVDWNTYGQDKTFLEHEGLAEFQVGGLTIVKLFFLMSFWSQYVGSHWIQSKFM